LNLSTSGIVIGLGIKGSFPGGSIRIQELLAKLLYFYFYSPGKHGPCRVERLNIVSNVEPVDIGCVQSVCMDEMINRIRLLSMQYRGQEPWNRSQVEE
jgi:hypothetical protein